MNGGPVQLHPVRATPCFISTVIVLYSQKTDVYACVKVFLVRKIKGNDSGHLYAMKVLKKATLKGCI